jgi:hypothetical protein
MPYERASYPHLQATPCADGANELAQIGFSEPLFVVPLYAYASPSSQEFHVAQTPNFAT